MYVWNEGILSDSQVHFGHEWISFLTTIALPQFPIHREIRCKHTLLGSLSSWWTFYIVIMKWCLQKFFPSGFLLWAIISLPTWKCEHAYIFPISWLFWQFSLKGRKNLIKFLLPPPQKQKHLQESWVACWRCWAAPAWSWLSRLLWPCPCRWGTHWKLSGKTHYK